MRALLTTRRLSGSASTAPLGCCPNFVIAASISSPLRTSAVLISRPKSRPCPSISFENWTLFGLSGFEISSTRLSDGCISFSSSSHLPPIENSKLVKPVTLPPGRARFSTMPSLTGSGTMVNTIGTV